MKGLRMALAMAVVWLSSALADVTPVSRIYMMRAGQEKELKSVISGYEPVLAKDPNAEEALKAVGIAYHNLGEQGAYGASYKAVEYLARASKVSPQDPEVTAYLGSATTMIARDSWNPVTKVQKVLEGTALIDKAIAEAPDSITVRFVRGNNTLELPGFFMRRQLAKNDFQHLVRLSNRPATSSSFTPEMRAEVHFKLGELLAEADQAQLAKVNWTEAAHVAPETKWGAEAKKRL